MEPENFTEFMDSRKFSLELLKSIRELDVRIDELRMVLGNGPCPGQPERRQAIVERVQRLVETRFCLVYSFMDINPNIKKTSESLNPFDAIPTDYDSIKREI